MYTATIRIAFRQIIDHTTTTPFGQNIFLATWSEFRVQQQSFSKGQPLLTWAEIKETFPKSNPALPFKVSFSIAGLINALGHQIPGLQDSLGLQTIPFAHHRFELLSSHATDASHHKIALTWFSPELTLCEIIGENLLLSAEPPGSFLLPLQPGLSVVSYQPHPTLQTAEPTITKPQPAKTASPLLTSSL